MEKNLGLLFSSSKNEFHNKFQNSHQSRYEAFLVMSNFSWIMYLVPKVLSLVLGIYIQCKL